jgi:PRC-barrel domain
MSSSLEGTPVRTTDAQDVGTIKGIAIGNDGSLSYLLALKGGRDVAVEPDALTMSFDVAND